MANTSSSWDDVGKLIDTVYKVLEPEVLFSKAKEGTWQTFFHHSASVAAIAYRLAQVYKEGVAWGVTKLEIATIEKRYGLPLEELAFLLGLAHDYAKLHGAEGGLGREKMEKILRAVLRELLIYESKADAVVRDLISAASAVEGVQVPELENMVLYHVARPVSFADRLASAGSIDEAMRTVLELKAALADITKGAIRVDYVKTSLPSLLQAKVSEKVVNVLKEHGWTPLVIYHDGVVLVGGANAITIPIHRVAEAIKEEVSRVFGVEDVLRQITAGLSRKGVARIYSKLAQTQGRALLGGTEPEDVYHDIIVKYLGDTPLSELVKELAEAKSKGRGKLLDVRVLATGLEHGGSKYFEEYLGAILTTREGLVNAVLALKKEGDHRNIFLLLTYMTAFASKDIDKVVSILRKAFGIELPKKVDKDLVYAVAMAEVFKRLDSDEEVKRVVEAVCDALGLKGDEELTHYIARFLLTSVKSNVVDLGSGDVLSLLTKSGYTNYCRVCGASLLSESIAFIEYARAAQAGGGGGSEIWLHDDPPLVSLEEVSTNKETRIRFICPLCYYEAKMLGEKYRAPFFVLALHPAVAYDVWLWIAKRLALLSLVLPTLVREADPREVAKEYASIVENGYKVVKGESGVSAEGVVVLVDFLGAKAIVPLGANSADMSLKMKDVVRMVLAAPYAMSLAGGGQVGVFDNIAHVYNLGTGQLPVIVPHHIELLYEVFRPFEEALITLRRRGMDIDAYAVYNLSYIAILKTLYAFAIKAFAWYSMWRGQRAGGATELKDYALELLVHMSSIPYAPLAIASPPPPSLDPRGGDGILPYYFLVSLISREVESYMSQAQKLVKGKEPPRLTKAIYIYVKSLKELRPDLTKHAVQKPLRRALDMLLTFAPILAVEEARNRAERELIVQLERTLNMDLTKVEKRFKDEESGAEKSVPYRLILEKAFDDIAETIIEVARQTHPSKVAKLIENILDSAYIDYRSIGEQ